jgi:hypothetical protein
MSINLIYPGRDTAALVSALSDDWLISGPIRACIFLSNAWHIREPQALTKHKDATGKGAVHYSLNGANIFGPNELSYSWSQWAALNDANYSWLVFFAQDMCAEYPKRFPHVSRHGITAMLTALENMPDSMPEGEWTEPWFAKEVEFEA